MLVAVWIKSESSGPIFFRQERRGQYGKIFSIYKFRTMVDDAESIGGKITAGEDPRITKSGKFLRKYKIDELPQLIDVLLGHMSLVGPRPEVRKFVDLYNKQQKKVLSVRPGITDYASIKFVRESELLAQSDTPEKLYVEKIMPEKLSLNITYIDDGDIFQDFKLILLTIWTIIKRS